MLSKYYIKTFGCQMNIADSQKLEAILQSSQNFKKTFDLSNADIVIINTCSIRKHAEDKVVSYIDYLRKWKETKKNRKIIVIGCFAQRKKEFLKQLNGVNKVIGTLEYEYLPEILSNELDAKFELKNSYTSERKITAFVPIMNGCNNFCSYCVVPYVRGKEISRPPYDIIKDVKILLDNGTKEITLIGQNVNSYSYTIQESFKSNDSELIHNKTSKVSFPQLLQLVAQIDNNKEYIVRFMTNHPKDISSDLIDIIKENQNIAKHIHLPLQSGSNRILELMNRQYTLEKYKEIIYLIRKEIPQVSITTDLIVGFPTETEKDFNDTYNAIKEIRFDSAFVFKYSLREETQAANLKDDVPKIVKEKRHRILLSLCENIARENNLKKLNKIERVLVEDLVNKKDKTYFIGKTFDNKSVEIKIIENANKEFLGSFLYIKITGIKKHSLVGEFVNCASNKENQKQSEYSINQF